MTEKEYKELEEIIRLLRKECPWDRIQTNDTIKEATLEEAYEVVEAIDQKDYDELKKELGDLLLHVIFHSVIAEEMNAFTLAEVINLEKEKLIRRHPHVFGNTEVKDHHDVKHNWEKIKLTEGRKSVVDGIPNELPALQRAHRIQEKVAKIGFEWTTREEAFKKVEEEIYELKHSLDKNLIDEIEDEFGDLLFSLVNFARLLNVNAETALRKANRKFIRRFQFIEEKLKLENRELKDLKIEELLSLWDLSKNIENIKRND
ncbi:MAG: nucleoside triphosphate pyrophosphohydrolase [Ignavibacteria bacterium]|jgi:XTP/dITP diphosphohydrolase|nr:nucleoside triphosphate pyrophosphohydrolase [Ignavibacteria bacterium]MDH7527610.1 nucleoside triphosphate pyrophosphohydrolase [Ignavibacteria bacterium]NPV12218.1 nucleoside triphosphate pyrophosphohydrolase [Ignavibacteria bacterium]